MSAPAIPLVVVVAGVGLAAAVALWRLAHRKPELRVSDRWLWERREARRRAELDAECGPSRPDRTRRK